MKTFLGIILSFVLLLNATPLLAQDVQETVHFDFDEAVINTTESEKLEQLVGEHGDEILEIVLKGHTDGYGTDDYNETLALERCEAVKQKLLALGVKEDQLSIAGFGETRPVATNEDATGRQLNRRVELGIHLDDFDAEAALRRLQEALKDDLQVFVFDAQEDVMVKGQDGTRFLFKANSLRYKDDGSIVQGKVRMELNEYYGLGALVLNDMHTETANDLLETGGSMKVTVSQDAREVMPDPTAGYVIYMPEAEPVADMQLFYGDHGANGHFVWEAGSSGQMSPNDFSTWGAGFNPNGAAPMNMVNVKRIKWPRRVACRISDGMTSVVRTKAEQTSKKDAREDRLDANNKYFLRYAEDFQRAAPMITDGPNWAALDPALLNIQQLNGYLFSAEGFGFINCDKFKTGAPRVNYMVSVPEGKAATDCKLVFKRIKSVMQGYPDKDGNMVFYGVPKNYEAKLVSIRVDRKEEALFSVEEVKCGEDIHELSSMRRVTRDELEKEIKKL